MYSRSGTYIFQLTIENTKKFRMMNHIFNHHIPYKLYINNKKLSTKYNQKYRNTPITAFYIAKLISINFKNY